MEIYLSKHTDFRIKTNVSAQLFIQHLFVYKFVDVELIGLKGWYFCSAEIPNWISNIQYVFFDVRARVLSEVESGSSKWSRWIDVTDYKESKQGDSC